MPALKAAIGAFHERGEFSEGDYRALCEALAPAAGSASSQTFTGLVGLFFERHLMDDRRRAELLAMDDEALGRAVRHRFRQLVADEQPTHRPYHALAPHVREALLGLAAPPKGLAFPAAIQTKSGFSGVAVEQAVAALWAEWGRRPSAPEATAELLGRYVAGASPEPITESREFPEILRARLDAQRLARGILTVFSADERDLLRAVLEGTAVEAWAEGRGVSRATAYRLYARLKALCELELKDRSHRTQLAAIDELRSTLLPGGGRGP